MDMKTSTTETVKVEMNFAPDVLVAMQMIGLYGDRLEQEMKRVTAKGESEAIALALEMKADLVLLDDYKARATAEFMGLNMTGTMVC